MRKWEQFVKWLAEKHEALYLCIPWSRRQKRLVLNMLEQQKVPMELFEKWEQLFRKAHSDAEFYRFLVFNAPSKETAIEMCLAVHEGETIARNVCNIDLQIQTGGI